MIILMITLILLNNTTYPGGYINVSVEGTGNISLPNCTYIEDSKILKNGSYTIRVSYSCKPGNYTIFADGSKYNFTVLNATYEYLINSTIKLEIENVKLKDRIRDLELENRNLTRELKHYINLTKDLKDENSILKRNIRDLKDKIDSLKGEIAKLKGDVKKLKSDKSYLESILSNLQRIFEYTKVFLSFVLAFLFGSYIAIIRR